MPPSTSADPAHWVSESRSSNSHIPQATDSTGCPSSKIDVSMAGSFGSAPAMESHPIPAVTARAPASRKTLKLLDFMAPAGINNGVHFTVQ